MVKFAGHAYAWQRLAALAAFAALVTLVSWPSARGQGSTEFSLDAYESEFYFTRLLYSSGGSAGYRPRGRGRGWGSWDTDWPEAETHLLQGIERLTRVEGAAEGRIVTLDDDTLMNYPWLYAVEVGRWYLSDQEAALLREYLLRGGFLMVDDFHGSLQWQIFHESMVKVFPDRPIVEIPDDDELMHMLYDLDKSIQIPGVQFLRSGRTYEQDGYVPYWRGIYDDDGRLLVAINFNMDLGDAWEHADNPYYPEPMTALAYRFAINYVIYSMTH
jgi:hypothetical protein